MDSTYLVVGYIMGVIACAIAGNYRQIGVGAAIAAGVFLSPVFGMGVVLASPASRQIELLEYIAEALSGEEEQEE